MILEDFVPPRSHPAEKRAFGPGPASRPPAGDVELALSIGSHGVGLELARPADAGPLRVTELFVGLPVQRFPLDVSGGVSKFRHRRGTLERLTVELGRDDAERAIATAASRELGKGSFDAWIAARPSGATVGLTDRASVTGLEPITLAFEVAVALGGERVELVVHGARGVNLPRPATCVALAVMEKALGSLGERRGARFVIGQLAHAVCRALLPGAGARMPGCDRMRFGAMAETRGTWLLFGSLEASEAELRPDVARVVEASELCRGADDAWMRADDEEARHRLLAALERAPRHPAVLRRLGELDAHVGGREVSALSFVLDVRRDADSEPALLRAMLLERSGRMRDAETAYEHAGRTERYPALAKHAFAGAARLATDPLTAIDYLSEAIARGPRDAEPRWARVRHQLALGRTEAVRADIEHLDALARGPTKKHSVWLRAAQLWLAHGCEEDARVSLQRAVRLSPDDPETLLALADLADAAHRPARSMALLERVVELTGGDSDHAARAKLKMAELSAGPLGDLPTAVFRASEVPTHATLGPKARALEARWRIALDDLAGASRAYAILGDEAERRPLDTPPDHALAEWLGEGAEFEASRGDRFRAERLARAATKMAPTDEALRVRLAPLRHVPESDRGEPAATAERDRKDEAPTRVASPPPPPASQPPLDPEMRVEVLREKFMANPTDPTVADELGSLLADLGRSHELIALVMGQLETAPESRKKAIFSRYERTFERLATDARERGDTFEAQLFEDVLAQFTDKG